MNTIFENFSENGQRGNSGFERTKTFQKSFAAFRASPLNEEFQEKHYFLRTKECVLENPRSFYGSFTLGPFRKGQGLTVANCLRRTLFTDIFGISINGVWLDGASHEYSTLEGVRESVLDLLFALKGGVFQSFFQFKKPVYGYLNVRGPGIVRMADLKLPPGLFCVDPDVYIATLTENGKLSAKVRFSDFSLAAQRNSSLAGNFEDHLSSDKEEKNAFLEENPVQRLSLGSFGKTTELKSENSSENVFEGMNTSFLEVDGNVHPVLKVNYTLENLHPTTASRGTELVHLELWTNGSLHPRKAISMAFSSLKNMFLSFEDMERVSFDFSKEFFASDESLSKLLKSFEYDFSFLQKAEKNFSDFEKGVEQIEDLEDEGVAISLKTERSLSLETSIAILKLPYRISACLSRKGLLTLGDLSCFRSQELSEVAGLGSFSLSVIQKKLKKIGFALKD